MYFKVEPTGCCERKGLVQVRYCLYLDPGDIGYDAHHVQMPVIPPEGYPGKIDGMIPVDQDDYQKWFDGLDKIWHDNPFHNHFCQFEANVTDDEIAFIGKLALQMAYDKLVMGKEPYISNLPVKWPVMSDTVKADARARIDAIKATTIEGRIDGDRYRSWGNR